MLQKQTWQPCEVVCTCLYIQIRTYIPRQYRQDYRDELCSHGQAVLTACSFVHTCTAKPASPHLNYIRVIFFPRRLAKTCYCMLVECFDGFICFYLIHAGEWRNRLALVLV